jgi:hypothetical protein
MLAFLKRNAGFFRADYALKKKMLEEAFFDLRTGIAGDILQKASNYRIRLAIVADFTKYVSKSLQDFMYESNQANQVLFVVATETAVDRLAQNEKQPNKSLKQTPKGPHGRGAADRTTAALDRRSAGRRNSMLYPFRFFGLLSVHENCLTMH